MLFQRAIPRGPAATPESIYTGMDLAARAPADRPYVVCNFVSSADGKATAQGRTALLGGDGDRAMFHLLRTQVDAIVAGTGTLRVERYGALVRDERLAQIRTREGRAAQPLAVVISRSGQIPFDIPLFADARSRIAIYAPAAITVPESAAQVELHEHPDEGDRELAGVLRSLRHEHDVRSLLCEGGPRLFTAMLAEDLVDELFLTLAPVLVGGHELGITAGQQLGAPAPLRLVWVLERDGHLFLRYARGDAVAASAPP
jgi:riboflavin biosynthesis pyrimidine reductase